MSQKEPLSITWPVPCPECGEGEIGPLARPGRRARYKNMEDLPLPAELEIPTCEACGREWIDRRTAAAVDGALEAEYQKRLRGLAVYWLRLLAEQQVTQRRLEKVLGLSHGYLSKLRSGASTPSPMLVGALQLLATDPDRRLREVEEAFRRAS